MAEYRRADPEQLLLFDERTKRCTMNCGPAAGDMRSTKERMFLCDDCDDIELVAVKSLSAEIDLLRNVFNTARATLRYNGVDEERFNNGLRQLDAACMAVIMFDEGDEL